DAKGRRRFAEAMEERRSKDQPAPWKALRRGWYFGGAATKEELLERMGREMGEHHGGEERQETDEQKAHRLVLEELRKRGWTEQRSEERRVGKEWRFEIVVELRIKTRSMKDIFEDI